MLDPAPRTRQDDRVNTYVRPSIDSPSFRGADGRVIPYGSRWGGSPPEDSYSVETNLERFALLHTVADALIGHLRDTYDVKSEEGPEASADLLHPAHHDVVRAMRIRPSDPRCAALTVLFTAHPGICVHAGLLNDFPYPVCGCDACDAIWQAEADELERQVFAVVMGRYRETVERRGLDPWVGYAFTYPDGSWSGGRREPGIPPARLQAAESVLRDLPEGWREWLRATGSGTRDDD